MKNFILWGVFFAIAYIVYKYINKRKIDGEEKNAQLKKKIENMDFFESYKCVAEYEKFNFKKVAKVLLMIIVAYVILIIVLSIKAGRMPDIVETIFRIPLILFFGFIISIIVFGKTAGSNVRNELEKKFNNEIWIPILTKHNYQNIIIGKYGEIRDIEIGLMNGDERKTEKNGLHVISLNIVL